MANAFEYTVFCAHLKTNKKLQSHLESFVIENNFVGCHKYRIKIIASTSTFHHFAHEEINYETGRCK